MHRGAQLPPNNPKKIDRYWLDVQDLAAGDDEDEDLDGVGDDTMTDVTKAGYYSIIIVIRVLNTDSQGLNNSFNYKKKILKHLKQVINKTNFRVCSWGKKRFKLRVVGKVIEMDNIYFLPKIC